MTARIIVEDAAKSFTLHTQGGAVIPRSRGLADRR
jgi:alpha-D-ribose 1-methylphosphonate 5-triphosphate synthase subunit PhnL